MVKESGVPEGYGTLPALSFEAQEDEDCVPQRFRFQKISPTNISRSGKIFLALVAVFGVLTISTHKSRGLNSFVLTGGVDDFSDFIYDFGKITPERPPTKNRKPKIYQKYSIDLIGHPTIQQALANAAKDDMLVKACNGPANSMDVFLNQQAMEADLVFENLDSYTVFDLDCRLPSGHHIAFLVVLGSKGDVVKIRQLERRAESVSMYNSSTLLASTQRGVWIWNYQTDVLEKLNFEADTHALVYVEQEDRYYGTFPDNEAVVLHDPNTVCSFDGKTGKTVFTDTLHQTSGWAWSDADAHMNWISVTPDAVYISERQKSALKKVNKATKTVEWNLGGHMNAFKIFDIDGNPVEIRMNNKDTTQPWNHQHRFQHIDDNYFTLFDNNIGANHAFIEKPWGQDSRMLVLFVDQEKREAYEVFSWPTGDRARSYGGTDILPSGNLLGSSYVDWVFPAMEDYQYHQNIWEVDPKGEVVWRVGFKGHNIVKPEDMTNPYPHYFKAKQDPAEIAAGKVLDIMPVGWNIYNVERIYRTPVVTKPCKYVAGDQDVLVFTPFNSIRTQMDTKGKALLTVEGSSEILAQEDFMFHKAWLPRPVALLVPQSAKGGPPTTGYGFYSASSESTGAQKMTLIITNHWAEFTIVQLGIIDEISECPDEDPYRPYYPSS